MFELTRVTAKLHSYSPRRELHGDDPQPAASLTFDVKLGADLLAMFAPTLRSSLFHKADGVVRNLADAASDANDLRYPQITDPIKWELEIVGAELTIHRGLGPKSDLVLPLCDVDNFSLLPMQGGIVAVRFRVACHPSESQSGKLAFLIAEEVEITLDPPEPVEDLADQASPPPKRGRGKREEARP